MVEGRGAIRDAAFATHASHPCAAPSTSGDSAIRRYPFTKRLSPRSKAPPAGLVMGRTGAAARHRGLSCYGVTSDFRGDAQRDAVGRATILCTTSVAVRADNPANQRG